jgi:hypothetical protein
MASITRLARTVSILAIVAVSLVLVAPAPASAAGTTITVDDPPSVVFTYEHTTISGTVSPAGATPKVFLQWQVAGVWKDIAQDAPSPASGRFELTIYPHDRGTYPIRVRSLHGSVTSAEQALVVKPHPTEISAAATPYQVTLGEATRINGRVIEPTATGRVVVQRKIGAVWYDRQSGVVDAKGYFSIRIVPSEIGTYRLRVRSQHGSRRSDEFFALVSPRPISMPATS